MRKTLLSVLSIVCLNSTMQAQNADVSNKHTELPKFFIGLACGVNQQSGVVGLNLELPVTSLVSIGTGVGNSTWGTKAFGEARYYFAPKYKGWAVGAGVTHSTGSRDMKLTLTTVGGANEKVELNTRPVTNAYFSAYKFGSLGKHRNRFYMQLGYSMPLNTAKYSVTSGQALTKDSERLVRILSPGGVIVAFGFSFAL